MRIGLRLLLGFFLILGVALVVVLNVFLQEVKPGTRLAMEDSLIDAAHAFAQLAAADMKAGTIATGGFAQALQAYPGAQPGASIWGFQKNSVDYRITITDAQGIVRFDTRQAAVGQDFSRWNDVLRTLRGEYGARSSLANPNDPNSTVMHVAAPIRDGDRIIGALTVSRPNRSLEPYIERSQQRILRWSWALLGLSLLMGVLLSWWVASSLSRLRGYANAVASGERVALPRFGRLSGNTEFNDLAQAVERMRVKLEDKAYVENYVHTLTHELKSPLAAIRGAAELLEEDLPEPDRQRFAGNIQRQTERLRQLIDKLLRLADVEQMRALRQREPVDLSALTRDLLQRAEPRLRLKGLRVRDELGRGEVVRGDAFLLGQALQNLLDNAIDFSPRQGELWLKLVNDGDALVWSVQDQGSGVPGYAQAHIFERFYSLPRCELQEKSSGLGLCLVKEVSDLHHGEIQVANVDQPPGCLVRWRLPL
ncbi:two-component system sensor histidine kinase CreC [Hydrogenophaga sp. PBL-H3]|uniref:two-component system sensor histidine kinase CreC n=1 Tax=Hydrogenophaga sp. PBL-H3 TaxID=434010 RepID=UPI00131F5A74|nr:two-component system sensor histidine kinase CreC [Hydrogenophaga sp. PBL-H3]QHE77236.1 two-component system sensor histidine kinase CreC [Hydrogenophaga sp. PBL-H3]QHE81660.1 two-component system sensor histidine kinase CreC [Hydrogenophaga sp. PBL-H3]